MGFAQRRRWVTQPKSNATIKPTTPVLNDCFVLWILHATISTSQTRLHRNRVDGIPQGHFQDWWVEMTPSILIVANYINRGHIVLTVTFSDSSRWVSDVCFGGDGPAQPMQLVECSTIRNMGTQDARLIRDFIPGQVSRASEHKMWQCQCRNSEDRPWTAFYSFSDRVE